MAAMTARELILQVYRKCNGELDPSVTPESEDGQTILSIINETIDYYYNSVDSRGHRIVWQRNIDPEYIIGDMSPTETMYDIDWNEVEALPDGFYQPIRVIGRDNKTTRFDLVPYEQLYDERHENTKRCSITGEGLVFAEPPGISGEIHWGVSVKGRHIDGDTLDVEATSGVHNMLWLLYKATAEFVRTDIVRGAQYPNVLAQANDVYARMISDNEMRTQALTYDSSGYSSETAYEYAYDLTYWG